MNFGSHFSSTFVHQLADKELRDEFVADRAKTRIALAIKALREQAGRGWSQKDLGDRAGKPQSVISRLEDPDYGKMSLQTLLEVAAAFDLPLLVEFPEWGDWLERTAVTSKVSFERAPFDADRLTGLQMSDPTGSPEHSAEVRHMTEFRAVNGNDVLKKDRFQFLATAS